MPLPLPAPAPAPLLQPHPVPVAVPDPAPSPPPRPCPPRAPPGLVAVSRAPSHRAARRHPHPGAQAYGPGAVPPGRYELYADFGYGLSNVGKLVDVVSDYETVVRCNTLRHTCDVAN
ncbi:MAG: hypothetical protein R3F59_28260 [Myxococcota bacterium]